MDYLEPQQSAYVVEAEYRRDYRPWRLRRGEVRQAVANFNTPNSQNTRRLLQMVDVDVWSEWTWMRGSFTMTPAEARERLDEWLKVRHAIAHGDEHMPDSRVLTRRPDGRRALWRRDAEACLEFIEELAYETSAAVFDELA